MHMILGLGRAPGTPTQICAPKAQSCPCLRGDSSFLAAQAPNLRITLGSFPSVSITNPPTNLSLPSKYTQVFTSHHPNCPIPDSSLFGGQMDSCKSPIGLLALTLPLPAVIGKSVKAKVSVATPFHILQRLPCHSG